MVGDSLSSKGMLWRCCGNAVRMLWLFCADHNGDFCDHSTISPLNIPGHPCSTLDGQRHGELRGHVVRMLWGFCANSVPYSVQNSMHFLMTFYSLSQNLTVRPPNQTTLTCPIGGLGNCTVVRGDVRGVLWWWSVIRVRCVTCHT